jgi:hypothetical protein
VGGVGYVFFMMRRKGDSVAAAPDEQAADFEVRYRSLIGQLKELAADRHLFTDETFAAEKARLELAATEVLKAKDKHLRGVRHEQEKTQARAAKLQAAQAEAANTLLGRYPAIKALLWTAGLVAFFAGLGFLLSKESKEAPAMAQRPAPMQNRPTERSPEDERLEAMITRLQREPENVDLLAQIAHELILRQDLQNALQLTQQGTSLDPFHVETRIHRALMDGTMGQPGAAITDLEKIVAVYPNSTEALIYIGVLSQQTGNTKKAVESLERYAAETPASEQPPMLREGIQELRKKLGDSGPN